MLTENQRIWVEALRSGRYQQGMDALRDGKGRYCCWGVACDLQDVTWRKNECIGDYKYYHIKEGDDIYEIYPPIHVVQQLGYEVDDYIPSHGNEVVGVLANMNDNGSSFLEIADVIEGLANGTCKIEDGAPVFVTEKE